jgi:hypothetical protein
MIISNPNPTFDSYTIECVFDADVLKRMLNDDTIAKDDKKKLKHINNRKTNHNTLSDVYLWTNKEKIGRLYCNSIQGLPKEYRNGLLNNTCFELDMKNAHFTFLSQIGKQYGLVTHEIDNYISNRDECLSKIHQDRNVAKELYLKAQYGGDIPDLKGLSNECKHILLRLKDEKQYLNIFEYAEKQYKKKNNPYKSLLHSFASFVLQTIENRCMLAVLDFMKQQDNMKVRIILHDGLILTKTDDLTKEVIKEIEDFVYDETDWRIFLDLKGCKSEYQPAEKDYVVVYNDEGACNYLHSVYGDKIVRTGDDRYCHLPNTKFYSKGEHAVRVLIKKINVYISTQDGDKPYSASKAGMNSIMEYLTKNCR